MIGETISPVISEKVREVVNEKVSDRDKAAARKVRIADLGY